jgi:plastocyanin
MRARLTALVALCLAATTLTAAPAGATVIVPITVVNMAFTPSAVTVNLSNRVVWTFKDAGVTHTSTSNQGFWNSGSKTFDQAFGKTFTYAGSFGYHCTFHSNMIGTIRVRLAHSGTPSAGYTIRWSTLTTVPTTLSFDVQEKKPGATTWTTLRSNTKTTSLFFNPSVNGSYALRARTRNLHNSTTSGWTPVVSLVIT